MKIMKSLKRWKGGKDDIDGKRGGERQEWLWQRERQGGCERKRR